ncbi:kinase-like domain-containing protein [Crepidotus variabilis]|uniref:Kinase-like domain-containing protein n=1 Tax=Crepidotus variabilis TaxID=179855 RepID=A0A9P6ECE5_9AGAR|nr:kinase-like domain-containing protein [Crepidotus variabilis]
MMHKESYLPVYDGMPKFDPSFPPAILTSASAVKSFLIGTPFECRSVTQFPGGSANYVYRLHLNAAIGDIETVVLKHAQPFFRAWEEISWELDRQALEVEAMTRVRIGLPSTSIVQVPQIFHFDAHNHFIVLEDCGLDVMTLKDLISSGSISSTSVAETIGSAVGEFIATLHEWSRNNPDGILDAFDECPHTKRMFANVTYDHIVSTLHGVDEDSLPLLSGLEIERSKIQTIQRLTDEYRAHVLAPGHSTRDVFLMGDLTYTNVLVSNDEQPLRIYLLDWELARTGLPGSEFGKFCAFLDSRMRGNLNAAELASKVQSSFLEAYSRHAKLDSRLAQDTLAHWGSTYIYRMPRQPLCEEKLVSDFVKEGVEYMAQSREKDFLAQSPVRVLLVDKRNI